jgi:hypothetical protein
MVKIIESTLLKNDLKIITKDVVNNTYFPWYWLEKPVTKNHPGMHHSMLPRYNYKTNEGYKVNSPAFDFFKRVFLDFCKKKKIKVNRILRAQLNLTWYFKGTHSAPHEDHDFKHKICIIYLNDFTKGSTYLFEEKPYKKITKEIKAKKGKIVIFPGVYHAAGFCGKQNEKRIICIISFD